MNEPNERVSQKQLDLSIPYQELVMIWNSSLPEQTEPPADFRWAKPEEIDGLKEQWISLLEKCGFGFDKTVQTEAWECMIRTDPEFFRNHLYALLDQNGQLACTVGIWPGHYFDHGCRIHWLMCDPNRQGKGLARAVLTKAMKSFREEFPSKMLHLSTQAQSWPAIFLYRSAGFEPWIENAPCEMRQAWLDGDATVRQKTGRHLLTFEERSKLKEEKEAAARKKSGSLAG